MGFWDTLVQANPNRIGSSYNGAFPGAYAAQYPTYEIISPAYQFPNSYTLATEGYRKNALVYSCITKRADAIAEAPCLLYDESGETSDELDNHPMRRLLKRPNSAMTEEQFWQITEINLLIAGFSAWEMELNNVGDVTALWPMRSDWCSFYRGDGKPMRAIRYQPYGLPFADVPIERVLLFQLYDPIFPLLKGLSPTAVALQFLGVDNSTTDFIKLFWQSGASVSGVLKTAQTLVDAEATRIRDRWRQSHGGYANWGDIAVLGSGAEYQRVEQTFKDMDFAIQDARIETRICSIYKVPPIVIGARVGIGVSSYNNFSESNRAFYQQTVRPDWRYLASEVREQLLPHFEQEPDKFSVEFDVSGIEGLQEEKEAVWSRAQGAWEKDGLTRDEFREEIGYDPIDNKPVFYSEVAIKLREALGGPGGGLPGSPQPIGADLGAMATATGEPAHILANESNRGEPADLLAQEAEAKQFRAFAQKRLKEGHPEKIGAFKFKATPVAKAMQMIAEAQPASDTGDPFPSWEDYG